MKKLATIVLILALALLTFACAAEPAIDPTQEPTPAVTAAVTVAPIATSVATTPVATPVPTPQPPTTKEIMERLAEIQMTVGFGYSDSLFPIADELGYEYASEVDLRDESVILHFTKEYGKDITATISIIHYPPEVMRYDLVTYTTNYLDSSKQYGNYETTLTRAFGDSNDSALNLDTGEWEFNSLYQLQIKDWLDANADAPIPNLLFNVPPAVTHLATKYGLDYWAYSYYDHQCSAGLSKQASDDTLKEVQISRRDPGSNGHIWVYEVVDGALQYSFPLFNGSSNLYSLYNDDLDLIDTSVAELFS